ncbi:MULTISPECIES: MraZ family transcriptional regulator [Hallerella]|uniref:division/cell wall cluster transcriptional repressor MraZ n=1 Tax=Hallerella TaxID=2815788 RepID=UPI0025837E2E|nr:MULTISPECIES: MraZ family transcriptional regulator [Hallerella]MCI6873421.1 MraZ family transcriptional regulator [Hallerella sp.]MDY5029602.1 MraZ family transcriptional regulator [Hallerella succinigenes]
MELNAFIGNAKTAIDEKGRSAFPREFRRLLSEEESSSLILAYGSRDSLILFTLEEYRKFIAKIESRPQTSKNVRFNRMFKANSHYVSLDGQNRILLSKNDIAYAKLDGEVLYVARSGKSAELWNPSIYNAKFGFNTEEDFNEFDAGFFDDEPSGDVDENR